MKNWIYPLIAITVIISVSFQSKESLFQPAPVDQLEFELLPSKPSLRDIQRSAAAFDANVKPWVVKAPEIHFISDQGELTQTFDDRASDNMRFQQIEDAIAQISKASSSGFDLEKRLDTLESQMVEVKSDVVDLSAGQADLVKRVEELAALIEVRCPDGKVKTATVALNATGTGSYNLAPGEILLSVDGVPVSPKASGGSTGSFTASTTSTQYGSTPPSPISGGSNGSLNYTAQTTNYQTSTYDVQTTPTPTATNVQVQRRPMQQLRSGGGLFNRGTRSTATCTGPNCPN